MSSAENIQYAAKEDGLSFSHWTKRYRRKARVNKSLLGIPILRNRILTLEPMPISTPTKICFLKKPSVSS
jgi:hypothetical protein